ncbi:hypothetical protein [Bdellovibrio sp. HCB2-146]|uniref:hypothetical protein n=1 Tax=Bdellovibrio sp. HCB2-146 TaxID=3394362 RepID=UPI0039BCC95F
MKSLLVLLVTVSAFAAQAKLDSHYGKVSRRGNVWTCTLNNKTDGTLDMKYVVFAFERLGSHGDGQWQVQERIDQRVRSGEKLSSSVREVAHTAQYCKFLAR